MKRDTLAERFCPIARASSELVDGWSFIILREILMGNRRFDVLQQQSGMNPRSLSNRLALLVESQILYKDDTGGSPARPHYGLTEKGKDLWPVLMTLKSWGERWTRDWSEEQPPMRLYHGEDKHLFNPQISCRECGEQVSASDIYTELSEGMIADRETMRLLNKR